MAIAACNFFCASATSSDAPPNNSIAPVNAENPPPAAVAALNTVSNWDVSDAMFFTSCAASPNASFKSPASFDNAAYSAVSCLPSKRITANASVIWRIWDVNFTVASP